jgi:hypothetical protein
MKHKLLALILIVAAAGCHRSPVQPTETPRITSVQPSSAAVGQTVTLTGSGFTGANTVQIGGGYVWNVAAADSTTLQFTLPQALQPCPPTAQVCIQVILLLQPGTYQVWVVNAGGSSNAATLQVVK